MKLHQLAGYLFAIFISVNLCHSKTADEVMHDSIVLMEKSDWKGALAALQPMVEKHANDGVKTFGSKFGVAYYYQGLCQLKIAQEARKVFDAKLAKEYYSQSIASFKQCYAINNSEQDIKIQTVNNYRIKSLMLQGNAEQAIEQYQAALSSYEKFLFERNSALDTYDIVDLNVNLAICYWMNASIDDDAKAEQLFLSALKIHHEQPHKHSVKSIFTGLRAMIKYSLTNDKKETLEEFMRGHRSLFHITASDTIETLPQLSAITFVAAKEGLLATTTALTTAIPSIESNNDLLSEEKLSQLEKIVPLFPEETPTLQGFPIEQDLLNEWKSYTKETLQATTEAEELALCARAIAFEKHQFYRGALSAYALLLDDPLYTHSSHRADYLYNASRIAIRSDKLATAYKYGSEYMQNHPEHEHSKSLQKLLMLTFYFSEEYEKSSSIAEAMPQDLKANEASHDAYLFSLGGSYYYQGRFPEAAPLLKQHSEKFTKSNYHETSSYLYASVLGKTHLWKQSIELLDQYIANHADEDLYVPFARYDKAFALYSLEKQREAELDLRVFNGKYDNSIIKPQAHILLGNILSLQSRRTEAITQYITAITSAKEVGNNHTKEEAYYLLISLLGQSTWDGLMNKRLPDAVAQFDNFMQEKDALKSPYLTQIITAAITALERAGRKEEAYTLLEDVLFLHNKQPNTPGVEAALKTYNITKRKAGMKDDDIISGITNHKHLSLSPYHLALILVAELDVLERSQRLSPNDDRAKRIKKLYLALQLDYEPQVIDNFALINIAEYINKQESSATNAKLYFDAILDSGSKIKLPQAQVGLASELAKSKDPKEVQLAMDRFQVIIDDPYARAKPKAAAHYQLIEILYQQQKFPELSKQCKLYSKYPSAVKNDIRRVEMLLATSYEKQNLTDKAIGAYTAVMVNSFENLDQSAPAVDRLTDLIWNRNNPAKEGLQDGKSDKQVAYEIAYKYNDRTDEHYQNKRNTLTTEGIDSWERISNKINTFKADKEVKAFK